MKWSEKTLEISYKVGGDANVATQYVLKQTLAHTVVEKEGKHSLTGRTITVELAKARPGGWKTPFKLKTKPKWLKTWYDRWDDSLAMLESSTENSGGEREEEDKGKGGKPLDNLRTALQEVEESERRAREARQKQLEEALKKGELPPPREEVKDGILLDGVD